jgi:hypothetical protein
MKPLKSSMWSLVSGVTHVEALWGLKNWVDLSVWLVGREIDGEAKTRLTLFPEKRTTGSPEGEPHATLSNLRS